MPDDDDDNDDDGLELEENDLALEDNDASVPAANPMLISPPRGWPGCFSTPALKEFVANELNGRKVRLSERPPEAEAELVHGLDLNPSDPRANAVRVREALGYDILGGFALYERADAVTGGSDAYTAQPHWWNVTPKGLWIDATPRPHAELVLVESGRIEVPAMSAELSERLSAIRLAQAEQEAVNAARRKEEKKAAKAAAKAAEKAAERAAKEERRQGKEERRQANRERKARKEAEAAERQAEMDRINAMQEDQLTRADPKLRAEKEAKEARERAEEEARLRAEYEAAAMRMAEERRQEEERAAEEARAEEEERQRKAAEEEAARQAREAAATKAREEKRLADAAKAAEKAAKAAAEAEAKLKAVGGTGLAWDLQVLLAPITPHKEAGAKKFGVGDHAGALEAYQTAIAAATSDPELIVWPAVESIVLACRANAALCLLKLGRNAAALAECDAALALPGANGCGKALLSKLLLRRLTALVEMSEDPLESVAPIELVKALRDARKRGLTAGKGAPAAKMFAELEARLEPPPEPMAEPDEQTQPLVEVVKILHTSFHPERPVDALPEMREQLEMLIDDEIGIAPSSPVAVAEPSGASLLWGLSAGLAAFPHAVQKDGCVDFYLQVLDMLLDHDVPVDMRLADERNTEISSKTALMYAASAGCTAAVRELLKQRANVNMRDPRGVTALMAVCSPACEAPIESRVDVAELLLQAGARVDARDIAGQSALMNACSKVDEPLVMALLEAGADVSLRHGKGCTAVGVLAGGLRNDDEAKASLARRLIGTCIERAPTEALRELLREEVKAAEFFDLQATLFPIHNRFIATPGARMGDREAALVAELCRQLGVPDDVLTRDGPLEGGPAWGNFFEALQRKLCKRIPEAFLRIYGEHPPVHEFALLTQFSSEAIAAAEARAASDATRYNGGVRTSAFHPETLRQESLLPYRHRGRVPRCMKDYQNLFVLPLRRCISHAVPTAQAIKTLAKLGPIVEMGAGSGYWAAMLEERKADVIAYDIDPPVASTLSNGFAFRQFANVHKGDAATLFATQPELAQRVLLLVWPGQADVGPRDEEGAASGWEALCLQAYMDAGGQTVVYVGEREESVKARPGTAPVIGAPSIRVSPLHALAPPRAHATFVERSSHRSA